MARAQSEGCAGEACQPESDMPQIHQSKHLERRAREIVDSLGGAWRRNRGMCRCPAHDDRTPSLSVSLGRHAILFHCFAGCSYQSFMSDAKAAAAAALRTITAKYLFIVNVLSCSVFMLHISTTKPRANRKLLSRTPGQQGGYAKASEDK